MSFTAAVGGASGSQKIAEMWKNHFSNLLNSVQNDEYKEFVYNNITCKNIYMNSSQYMGDVSTIQSLMCKLPFNSAVGSDGISVEHICFADSTVALYLSLFFNMCILCGYIPKPCINTVIVPIVKSKNGNHQDCGNYRPIAIATVVLKLFEQVILINIKNFLGTTDNQFGFKTKHRTDMCVFLLKQAISYYIIRGSPIFCVFLDVSKAFDRVNHYLLFQKLIVRNVSMCFVRLLVYWYTQQSMQIRWGRSYSSLFSVTNGVRQGSIKSIFFGNLHR